VVENAGAVQQTVFMIKAWILNWKKKRKRNGTKIETKRKQSKDLMELTPAVPGLGVIPTMEPSMVEAPITKATTMETPITVDTPSAAHTAAPIIMKTLTMATLVAEASIIKGTHITSIGTRVAALSMETRDQATMTMTYMTMSTSTFASTSATAWEITAMVMNIQTVAGVRSGIALFMRWGIRMAVIATKSQEVFEKCVAQS